MLAIDSGENRNAPTGIGPVFPSEAAHLTSGPDATLRLGVCHLQATTQGVDLDVELTQGDGGLRPARLDIWLPHGHDVQLDVFPRPCGQDTSDEGEVLGGHLMALPKRVLTTREGKDNLPTLGGQEDDVNQRPLGGLGVGELAPPHGQLNTLDILDCDVHGTSFLPRLFLRGMPDGVYIFRDPLSKYRGGSIRLITPAPPPAPPPFGADWRGPPPPVS